MTVLRITLPDSVNVEEVIDYIRRAGGTVYEIDDKPILPLGPIRTPEEQAKLIAEVEEAAKHANQDTIGEMIRFMEAEQEFYRSYKDVRETEQGASDAENQQ